MAEPAKQAVGLVGVLAEALPAPAASAGAPPVARMIAVIRRRQRA